MTTDDRIPTTRRVLEKLSTRPTASPEPLADLKLRIARRRRRATGLILSLSGVVIVGLVVAVVAFPRDEQPTDALRPVDATTDAHLAAPATAPPSPSSGDSSSSAGVPNLARRSLAALVEGTVEPPQNTGDWTLVVQRVDWLRGSIRSSSGRVVELALIEVGDRIPVFVDVDLTEEQRYVMILSQSGFNDPANPQWNAHGIMNADESLSMVQLFAPGPEDLLFSSEANNAETKRAGLVEFLAQAAEFQDSGESAEPGPRLALVLEEPPEPAVAINDNLGMTLEQYLDLPASDRQLHEFAVMPSAVVEALELVPLEAVIVLPNDLSDVWGVGVKTAAGTVGPVRPSDGWALIEGSRPLSGALVLVVWYEQPADLLAPFGPLASRVDVPWINAGIHEVTPELTGEEVLLVDAASRSVKTISFRTADDLLKSFKDT